MDFSIGTNNIPSGMTKLLYIRDITPVPVSAINASAAAAPGSIWYVLGEPNVHGTNPADVVVALHDTYAAIKAADPTAKITSPSLLNFDFTCVGCGGYQSGRSWLGSFITEYSTLYGGAPPVDYWAIDVYPIIWNELPTTRADIVIDQISTLRAYLDGYPALVSAPIIVTELGLHWGFTGLTFNDPVCSGSYPTGEYQTDAVIDYLKEIFLWLEDNSSTKNISSWYLFSTYRNLTACHADAGYGLTLFETNGANPKLSPVGQFYYNWIRGARD
jgi:hypothetical protein